jgi:hypothetical protein
VSSGGLIPFARNVVNHAKAFVRGGSAEEQRLLTALLAELKSDLAHMKEYVKDNTFESHLDTLILKILAYEKEFDRGHPEDHHIRPHLDASSASVFAARNVYYPQPLGMAVPWNGVYYQWVVHPYPRPI